MLPRPMGACGPWRSALQGFQGLQARFQLPLLLLQLQYVQRLLLHHLQQAVLHVAHFHAALVQHLAQFLLKRSRLY